MSCACDQIDVWLIPLDSGGRNEILSPEEAARAARFIFPRDRAHFITAHSALREILARYAGQDAAALAIKTAEKGKPYLADYPRIRFNLSHSGAYAMLAVALDRELGVDIESIKPDRSTTDIAERFFAPAEVAALKTAPDQVAAFFNCWSRKEAYIKARGLGLGIPLDSFTVSLGDKAELLHAEDRHRWSMCALEAPRGYAAALVAEGSGWTVSHSRWPD